MTIRLLAVLAAGLGLAVSGAAAAADPWKKAPGAIDSDLLPAESAFQLVAATRDGDAVTLDWVIAPGYYLYRKRLAFEAVEPSTTRLGAVRLPAGQTLHDEHFGDVEVYRETLQARLPLTSGKAALAKLRVRFQGCADAGVCYPPVTRVVDVTTAAK